MEEEMEREEGRRMRRRTDWRAVRPQRTIRVVDLRGGIEVLG